MMKAGAIIGAAGVTALLAGGAMAQSVAETAVPETPEETAPVIHYEGIETRLLDSDLVNFRVSLRGARDAEDVSEYADCAAAQYTLIRGYGFARHLRTNVYERSGHWEADAVYTVSKARPQGKRLIEADVVAAQCADNGIPTV